MTPVNTPSEAAVEAAARAMFDADHWERLGSTTRKWWRDLARLTLNSAYAVDFPNDHQDLRTKIEALLAIYEKLNDSNARKASASDTSYFDGAHAETHLIVHTLQRILAGGEV